MRFLMIVKASKESEAGVMLDGTGLKPSSHGPRIQYSGTKRTPFFELEDFAPGPAIDHHKELDKQLKNQKG